MAQINKNESRQKRHTRVRKRVQGTPERPRLNVYRSSNNIYAQIIDDLAGRTLAAASSLDASLKGRQARARARAATSKRQNPSARWSPSARKRQALPKWSLTAAATFITGAFRHWPMRRARMDWISNMALINPDTLNLEERVIQTNKVQKTHKGGRTMSWSILVVVGDGNGYVGAGIGKARAIPDAIRKGVEAARKSLVHVPMVGSTIPHDVLLRQGGAEVLLKPASPGTGVVAGGSVRAILEAAGVKDVLAKSLGSSNKVNTAWATIAAL